MSLTPDDAATAHWRWLLDRDKFSLWDGRRGVGIRWMQDLGDGMERFEAYHTSGRRVTFERVFGGDLAGLLDAADHALLAVAA